MKIHLENFEIDSIPKSTPDVLNSPLSLRACSSLGIQPKELVYRNLEEYEELLPDLPLSSIYKIYDIDETKRQSKLLKCREFRKQLILEEARFEKHEFSEHVLSTLTRHPELLGGSNPEINYGSETESYEDDLPLSSNEKEINHSSAENKRENQTEQTSVNSLPSQTQPQKLNSTAKKQKSHHSHLHKKLCPCHFYLDDQGRFDGVRRKYQDVLRSKIDLSKEDQKLLELFILRKTKDAYWDKRIDEHRQTIEEDRISQYLQNQLRLQNMADRLARKRQLQNTDNMERYLSLQRQTETRRLNLLNYLESRDLKVKQYLDQLQYEQRKHIVEKQEKDALHQLEVGRTMDRLFEADKLHRMEIAENIQKRQHNSELRRKRREADHLRHVSEMNRLEELKGKLRLERIDAEAHLARETLRNHLEEKEHRANMNYLAQLRIRNIILGAGNRNQTVEKTRRIHSELLRGIEEWNARIHELHLLTQKRASENHFTEIDRRRARAAGERIHREERNTEILTRVREMEYEKLEQMRILIEAKDWKIARWKENRDQFIHANRLRAQHGAELREALREKFDPQTFDKKVARAQIEAEIFGKPRPIVATFGSLPQMLASCRCGCTRV